MSTKNLLVLTVTPTPTLNILTNQIEVNDATLKGKQKQEFLLVKILRAGVRLRTFFVLWYLMLLTYSIVQIMIRLMFEC